MTIILLPPPSPGPALPATTVRENTGSRMARALAIPADRTRTAVALKEIAALLGDVTLVASYRQLARWIRERNDQKSPHGPLYGSHTDDEPRCGPDVAVPSSP
jgi:transposase